MDSSEWRAAYKYNRNGEVLLLELDLKSGITGKPPANMNLEKNT